MSLFIYLLTGVLTLCDGLRVLGPSGPLTVELRGSVVLPCYVKDPVPLGELEVEWKKNDTQILLHLFQDGESRPESQGHDYIGRASFFTEEIKHRNFSLLLTNLTLKDSGVYTCAVHAKQESGQTLAEIKEIEPYVINGGRAVSAYVGEDITLNCSVDSLVPVENLQVSWKNVHQQILVYYDKGNLSTEATHGRYMERVEFFSQEEICRGNFSLRLKDLRTEDKGLYICSVAYMQFSVYKTMEVQQLGFSSLHIWILCLCVLAVCQAVFLCALTVWPSYLKNTALKTKDDDDNHRKPFIIQYELVFGPNIALFLAFIFWGATEGFFSEAATCSAFSLLRICFLFWILPYLDTFQGSFTEAVTRSAQKIFSLIHMASYLDTFKEKLKRFVQRSTVALGFTVVATFTYSVFAVGYIKLYWSNDSIKHKMWMVWMVVLLIILLLFYTNIFIHDLFEKFSESQAKCNYVFAELANFGRVACISFFDVEYFKMSRDPFRTEVIRIRRPLLLIWMSVLAVLEAMNAPLSVYIHFVELKKANLEHVAGTGVAAYLYILTAMLLLEHVSHFCARYYEGSCSKGTKAEQSLGLIHASVYMLGAVGLVVVNSVVLVTELIQKARVGNRTLKNLQDVLIPFECVFALCCLGLQLSSFLQKYRKGFMADLRDLCQLSRSKPPSRDSLVHEDGALNVKENGAAASPS
ncbi:uncharacterized protein [Hoplias malabaricus]|uniref:uncharacterized protein isoform X2 n=1 Tax=Hoplias malabaricus TaxID=27720 RepID=UPI0034632B0B